MYETTHCTCTLGRQGAETSVSERDWCTHVALDSGRVFLDQLPSLLLFQDLPPSCSLLRPVEIR